MKLYSSIVLLLLCISVNRCYSRSSLNAESVSEESNGIKTILAQVDYATPHTWSVSSDHGFTLTDYAKNKSITVKNKKLDIVLKNNGLYINGKKIKSDRLRISTPETAFTFQGNVYTGSLLIAHKNNQLLLVQYEPKSRMLSKTVPDQEKKHTTTEVAKSKEPVSDENHEYKENQFTVRVLLEEKKQPFGEPWILTSQKGFLLIDPENVDKKMQLAVRTMQLHLQKDGTIYINGRKWLKNQLYITPMGSSTAFKERSYLGSFWVVSENNNAMIINCVGIEDYVASVLYTESWPGWPLEVNKVFAIASRTYVIAMVKNASLYSRLYHVKNTNAHQTYTGGNAHPIHKQAVESTKGLFLTYKNNPITAMFDACCGGVIPAKMDGVDFTSSPYLARSYPCHYCKTCKIYSWEVAYDQHEIELLLKKELQTLSRLKDIKINKKDKAGLVKQLQIKCAGRSLTLTGKKAYSLLKNGIKSFCFSVRKNAETYIFKGKGYGHHLGLCQWGAKEMVADGWDHKSILDFYYPGTKLMRLL